MAVGVDPAKITLGLAFYGRNYIVNDTSCEEVGCAAAGLGPPGVCDDSPGYMSYDQVFSVISDPSTAIYYDESAAVRIAKYDAGKQWLFYEDTETLAKKVDYANTHCIGGKIVPIPLSELILLTVKASTSGRLIWTNLAAQSRLYLQAPSNSRYPHKTNLIRAIHCLNANGRIVSILQRHALDKV